MAGMSIIYGYGFKVLCSDAVIVSFIKNHKDAFCKSEMEKEIYEELMEVTDGNYELDAVFVDYDCDISGDTGVGAVIANIMQRETGISFEFRRSDDTNVENPTVFFVETMPWFMNETEKYLTKNDFSAIVDKYAKELLIGVKDIGNKELEYCD